MLIEQEYQRLLASEEEQRKREQERINKVNRLQDVVDAFINMDEESEEEYP